jgi:iron complex outermembrane receptor protein
MKVGAGNLGPGRGVSRAVLLTAFMSVAVLEAGAGQVELCGIVLDPSHHSISGAAIALVSSTTGVSRKVRSDKSGQYQFPDLPAGTYLLKVSYPGFAPYSQEVTLEKSELRNLDVMLRLAARRESVTVTTAATGAYTPMGGSERGVAAPDQLRSLNAAELLGDAPGLSLRASGGLASIPILHGLDDDRVKVVTNGMTVSPSCPNHMNPPLSYLDPAGVAQVSVMAGITPVSLGGDSLGGTITVDSPPPVFAAPGARLHSEGAFSTHYRSNGESYGPSLEGSLSTPHFSFGYSGSWFNTDDYRDGSGHRVTSTYAQNTNNVLTLAAQGAGNLFVLQAGFQNTPYEGFPNQQMDLVGNRSEFLNFRYRRSVGKSVLDARVFWQNVRHEMNLGRDKSTFPMPMWMPMDTHGRDLGYTVKMAIPLAERHTVQFGSEFQRFTLDSTWPAVPGTAPYMGPNPFISMNDGERSRLAWFAEAASKWNSKWTTLLGLRNDTVWTNTGPVSGYSDMYSLEAEAFNALKRERTDLDLDLTALARYEPNARMTFEMGYARKSRAPNLYERYAWSTDWMTSGMINWFGDGNYYVGNVDLKPEVAHTASGTASWHDAARQAWEIKVTPYQTYVRDYIDVNELATQMVGMSTFSQLMFANHDATIWGADLDANAALWKSLKYGRGELEGVGGWLHGRRLDTRTGLYQMMPLHARVDLKEKFKGFTGGPEIQMVDRKQDTDPLRFEPRTPGYTLLNFNAGYRWRRLLLEAGATNLLNRWYYLPLGGVNFDNFLAGGEMGQILPLTGAGRSFYVGMSVPF